MEPTRITGFDPGLVHTGAVSMLFVPLARKIVVEHEVILGIDPQAMAAHVAWRNGQTNHRRRIFVEEYRPRIGYAQDTRMVEGQSKIRTQFGRLATFVNNTGSKKIVRRELMNLLGVWKFNTPTHHQDLRSAARIAIFGMLKDEELNKLVTRVVKDHLEGDTWHVEHR